MLATPTAVVAAIGNAAKRGMLVKSGAVIEQVGKVDVVAFDKTGTLTHGKPVVQQIIPWTGISRTSILSLAASIERGSEHPIGRSIVQAGLDRQIELVTVDHSPSCPAMASPVGVETKSGDVIGNRALLAKQDLAGQPKWIRRCSSSKAWGRR